MMITPAATIAGHRVTETLGLVRGNTIRDLHIGKDRKIPNSGEKQSGDKRHKIRQCKSDWKKLNGLNRLN